MFATSTVSGKGRVFPGMICTDEESSIATPNLTPSTTSNSSYSTFSNKSNNTIVTSLSVPNTPSSRKHIPSPHRSKIDTNYLNRLPSSCKSTNNQHFFSPSPCHSPMMGRSGQSTIRTPNTTPTTQRSRSSNTTCFFTAEDNMGNETSLYDINSPRYSNNYLYDDTLDQSTLHDNNSYSNRYIPSRKYSNVSYSAISSPYNRKNEMKDNISRANISSTNYQRSNSNTTSSNSDSNANNENTNKPETIIQTLLQNELLENDPRRVLRYNSSPRQSGSLVKPLNVTSPMKLIDNESEKMFLKKNKHLLFSQKRKRRISKVPFKVLDAPSLQDDFYLNLVDW